PPGNIQSVKELKISVLIPLLGCVTGLLAGASASAQTQGPAPVWGEVFVGSELENYLRAVQLADQSRPHPWSIRGFGPGEVQRLAPGRVGHPWADRYDFVVDSATAPLAWVRPAAR